MVKARVGQTVSVMLPWSEVCMHMGVADQTMNVYVTERGAQLLREDGSPYCGLITHGEAGVRVVSDTFEPGHGYVCKRCGGPSPLGVGYVDARDGAADRSAGLVSCGCSYSVAATEVAG